MKIRLKQALILFGEHVGYGCTLEFISNQIRDIGEQAMIRAMAAAVILRAEMLTVEAPAKLVWPLDDFKDIVHCDFTGLPGKLIPSLSPFIGPDDAARH